MSPGVRRRRALLFLALALASGGLAASQVGERARAVEAQVGSPVPVVVTARELAPGAELRPERLAVREVPQRFAPADALPSVDQAAGARAAVRLVAGSYVTAGELQGAERGTRRGGLRRGERAVELAVAGGDALSGAAGPGARVDVLVSTERGAGGRTFLALEDVELLALRPGGGGDPASGSGESHATATATLRVTPRQAVYLTAAQNFAREVRLLVRPAGDGRREGRAAISAGEL